MSEEVKVEKNNKKTVTMTVMILAIIVILCAVIFFCIQNNEKKDNTTPIELNLEEVSSNISTQAGFANMAMQDIDSELATTLFDIEATQIEGIVGKFPLINVKSSMYVIIKTNAPESVKEKLETYGKSYEQQWERYLPDQYELVKNRKIGVKGNYVYMIIADDAESLVTLLK